MPWQKFSLCKFPEPGTRKINPDLFSPHPQCCAMARGQLGKGSVRNQVALNPHQEPQPLQQHEFHHSEQFTNNCSTQAPKCNTKHKAHKCGTKPCKTKRHNVPPWVRQLDSLGVSPCWLVRRRRGAHSGCELAKRAINPGLFSPSPPFPTFLPSLCTTLGIMNTLFPISPVCAGYCSCSFGT